MNKDFFYKIKLIFIPCNANTYKPKLLDGKFLLYYAIVLLVLKLVIVPFLIYFPKTSFFADLTRTSLIELANNSREYLGYQPLKESQTLNEAAYLKAKDMVEKGYFAHYSPDGISPWFWLQETNYSYQSAGENLAVGFLESEQVHLAWMDSLSHKKNILNPNYQEIGIAVLKDNFRGNETTLVVQYFGTPRDLPLEERILMPEMAPEKTTEEAVAEEEPQDIPVVVGEEEQVAAAEEELFNENDVEEKEKDKIFAEEIIEKTPALFLFQFMTSDYYGFLQKIIYGSLVFIIFSLLVTIYYDLFVYRKFEIQYKDIVFKTAGFSALWLTLVFLDKMIILRLIAYNFTIN